MFAQTHASHLQRTCCPAHQPSIDLQHFMHVQPGSDADRDDSPWRAVVAWSQNLAQALACRSNVLHTCAARSRKKVPVLDTASGNTRICGTGQDTARLTGNAPSWWKHRRLCRCLQAVPWADLAKSADARHIIRGLSFAWRTCAVAPCRRVWCMLCPANITCNIRPHLGCCVEASAPGIRHDALTQWSADSCQ